MRKLFVVLVVVFCLVVIGQPTDAATTLISGTVKANNQSVTSGWVELSGNNQVSGSEISNGQYTINQETGQTWTTGTYTLKVIPDTKIYPTYASKSEQVSITVGMTASKNVELATAVKKIEVTVTDETGKPVIVSVRAKASGGGGGMRFDNSTNSSGFVSFTVRPEGAPYYLSFDNCVPGTDGSQDCVPWTYTGEQQEISFALADDQSETQKVSVKGMATTAVVTGKILYEGVGFEGFIHLYNDEHLFSGWMESTGIFTVYTLPGSYKVDLLPKQSQTNTDVVRYYIDEKTIGGAITANEGTNDVGTLAASYEDSTIMANIVDDSGNKLEAVTANFWLAGGGEWRQITLMPGSVGIIGSEAHAGVYYVNAVDPTGAYFSAPAQMVVVEEKSEPTVSLTMIKTNAGASFIVKNSSGARDGTFNSFVDCWDATNERGNGAALVRGFGFVQLVAGTYTCSTITPENATSSIAPVEVTVASGEATTVDLTLVGHSSTLTGTLTDQSGEPIKPSDDNETPLLIVLEGETYGRFEVEVQGEGTWSDSLPPDTYTISVTGDETIDMVGLSEKTLTVAEGESKSDATVEAIAPDATITTTVMNPDGSTPLAFAQVTCSYLPDGEKGDFDGGRVIEVSGETNESGEVSIPVLSKDGDTALTYDCGVSVPEGQDAIAPASVRVEPDGTVEMTTFEADTTLSVTYESSETLTDVQCQAWAEDGTGMVTGTDEDGDGKMELDVSAKASKEWNVSCSGTDGSALFTPEETQAVSVPSAGDYSATVEVKESTIAIPEGASQSFDATAEKSVSLDGVTLDIPSNAIESGGDVTLTVTPTAADIPKNEENMNLGVPLSLQAFDDDGNIQTSFTEPIAVTIPYSDAEVEAAGLVETDLVPKFYNESSGTWELVDGFQLDTEKNTLNFSTDHFTQFAVLFNARIAGEAPALVQKVAVPKKKLKSTQAQVTWKAVSGADSYELVLSNAKGKRIKRFTGIATNKYALPKKYLKPGKKYRVRVRAVGGNGLYGTYSKAKVFRTLKKGS